VSTKSPPKAAAPKKRRQQGSGGLVDLGDGRWKIVTWSVAADGRRQQMTRTVQSSKAEAKRRLDEFVAKAKRGAIANDGEVTYAQLVERFLAAKTVSQEETSVALYRRTLVTHALPSIGKVRLRDLTAAHVQRVLSGARNASRTKQRGEPLGSTSLRNLRVYIRASLGYAFKLGLVVKNVADQVEVPKTEHVERVEVTVDVAREIMSAVRGTPLESLAVFALATGARRGEACGLQWSDVDLESGRFSIRRAAKNVGGRVVVGKVKTRRSERSDTLPGFAVESLLAHRRRQREQDLALGIRRDDGFVFRPGVGDEPWDPNELSRTFSRLVRRKKLPVGLRWHDLRHGYATLCFASGSSLKVVSEALGHSSVAVTSAIYVHVLDEAKAEKSRRLDAYLGNALRDPAVGQ